MRTILEEAIGNMHLMTAAPELYAELQKLVDWFELGDCSDSFIAGAKKALNKARGEIPQGD